MRNEYLCFIFVIHSKKYNEMPENTRIQKRKFNTDTGLNYNKKTAIAS